MAQLYDAIVIGAGHNGLTCACYLARAGLRTLVVDQYHTVGGMATTEEITLPGFRSDMHAFGFQLANLSPVTAELGLADFGLELIRPEINHSHVFPDGGIISMHRDVERTVASIGRYSKEDGETWRLLAGDFVRARESIAVWMNAPPAALLQQTEQLVKLPEGMDEYRAGLQSFRSWGNEHFEREETRLFIGGWACHVSLGPDDVGGGHMC
jgi:phytoene dehydrogenase-like protein